MRTRRAAEIIELHAAHGYLSSRVSLAAVSNHRDDEYGGVFENRTRLVREVIEAVRRVWPDRCPLLMRISATDWTEGGWTEDDSVSLAAAVKPLGVDLVDCSSGGNVAHARIPLAPGYQVPFAAAVRHGADMPTGAVGLITDAEQADAIIRSGSADVVFLARALLRDPYWPIHAARTLKHDAVVPRQYLRAF